MSRSRPLGDRSDVLRSARRAVAAGQFRAAWEELARVKGSVRESAEWLLLAAMAGWRLGEFARARTTALQARDRYRAIGDVDGEMRADNVAAAGAFALGDLTAARAGFRRALTLADTKRDELMIARCANNLGNIEYYHAEYASALGFYRLARANFERCTFLIGLAETWLNAAIVWREDGDLSASRAAAAEAVESAERAQADRLFGQALAASGETSMALGDVALAQVQTDRALGLARAHDDPLGEADALRILGIIATEQGEYERAGALIREALSLTAALHHPWAEAEIYRSLAELERRSGRREEAARALAGAAAAYERLGATARAAAMRAEESTRDT